MGGCYSTTSHKALTPSQHKQPKKGSVKKNGKSPDNSTHGCNGNGVPGNDDKSKEYHILSTEDVPLLKSQDEENAKGVAPSDSGIESIGTPQEETGQEAAKQSSESPEEGVEQEQKSTHEFSLCQACHQRLQRISHGSCHQCGNFRIDSAELSSLVSGDTYCTCGPRVLGKQSTCRTHRLKGSNVPTHRHSDMLSMVLKSNLKKHKCWRGDRKHVRMSWKSADSLDMGGTMNTCMDHAKSEASEIFGDDVSFRAPLAQFDSVECQLDEDGGHADAEFLESRMSIYSEILDLADCICKCEFSNDQEQHHLEAGTSGPANLGSDTSACPCVQTNSTCHLAASPSQMPPIVRQVHARILDEEDDDDSGHGVSKSEDRSGVSDSDLDTGEESDRLLSTQSSPSRQGVVGLDVDWSEVAGRGVCSVTVKGRQMVMMDAGTYTQMLSDLAVLREQLSHLTQVIQEEEGLEPLNLALHLDK